MPTYNMSMKNTLQNLIDKTGCHLQVDYNNHKTMYQSTKEAIDNLDMLDGSWREDVVGCTVVDMIEKDTIIELRIYPDTPVGFNNWYGVQIQPLIDAAFKWIDD